MGEPENYIYLLLYCSLLFFFLFLNTKDVIIKKMVINNLLTRFKRINYKPIYINLRDYKKLSVKFVNFIFSK